MIKKIISIIVIFVSTTALVQPVAAAVRKLPAVPNVKVSQVGATAVIQWGKPLSKFTYTGVIIFRSDKLGKVGPEIGRVIKDKLSFTDKKVVAGKTYYYTVNYYAGGVPVTVGRQMKLIVKSVLAKQPTTSPTKTAQDEAAPPTTPNNPASPAVNSPTASPGEPNINSSPNPVVAPVTDSKATANDLERVTTLKQLQIALAQYFESQGNYPVGTNLILGQPGTSCLNSDGWGISGDCPYPYFGTIPKDPGGSAYSYSGSDSSYIVRVTLDGVVNGLSGRIALTPNGIVKN